MTRLTRLTRLTPAQRNNIDRVISIIDRGAGSKVWKFMIWSVERDEPIFSGPQAPKQTKAEWRKQMKGRL